VVRRLAFSLDTFQRAEKEWERIFCLPMEQWSDHLDQIIFGVAADSISHYFNICFDDVWRLVPFVFSPASPDESGKYSEFKDLLKAGKYACVRPLFDKLTSPGTWWHSMFKWKSGIRQRFVHYTDMFEVMGHRSPGEEYSKVFAFVRSPYSAGERIDFIATLR